MVLKIKNLSKLNRKHVDLLGPIAQQLVSINMRLSSPAAGLALEELLPFLPNLKKIGLKGMMNSFAHTSITRRA